MNEPMPEWEVELRHGELHRENPHVRAALAELDRLRAELAETKAGQLDLTSPAIARLAECEDQLAERTRERDDALAACERKEPKP